MTFSQLYKCVACASLALSTLTANAWAEPSVSSISPHQFDLVPGGPPATVKISGVDLTSLRSVRLATGPGLSSVRGLSATRTATTNTSLKMEIAAESALRIGRYRMQLIADDKQIGTLEIVITATARTSTVTSTIPRAIAQYKPRVIASPQRSAAAVAGGTRTAVAGLRREGLRRVDEGRRVARALPTTLSAQYCTQQSGVLPPPQITSFSPLLWGSSGGKISFVGPSGANFQPSKFCARIGSEYLKITSRTANLIEAELPDRRLTGSLFVSHGTSTSEHALEQYYTVFGPPVITAVSPTSITRGDIVTVTGTDLGGIHEFTIASNFTTRAVKISSSNSNSGSEFMAAEEWAMNSEGTQITFRAGPIFEGSVDSLPLTPAAPQPQQLSGQLRFARITNSTGGRYLVAGPAVTWKPDVTLSLTSVSPPRWGDAIPNFLILESGYELTNGNIIRIEGTNLRRADFKIGELDLIQSISAHGRNGNLFVPAHATTNYLTVNKDGQSVVSAEPLVLIAPQFLNTPPTDIKIGQQISLMGWGLKPSNTHGLVFEFKLSGLPNASCNVDLSIDEHTEYSIKFTVVQSGAIPSGCLQTNLFGAGTTRHVAQFVARFNDVERELWRGPYQLTP